MGNWFIKEGQNECKHGSSHLKTLHTNFLKKFERLLQIWSKRRCFSSLRGRSVTNGWNHELGNRAINHFAEDLDY